MLFTSKSKLSISTAALLLSLSLNAYAAPPFFGPLDDFLPNCDVRQLALTAQQIDQLRDIRQQHKLAINHAQQQHQRFNQNRRRYLLKILSNERFNQRAANDYVNARYAANIDFAVSEMQIQHQFYQSLSPLQRQQWLNSCLK